MKKILLLVLAAAGAAAFVGFDAVGAVVRHARESVRASLAGAVPLKTHLAEAQAQVDAYAESVIRGEVASDRLRETVAATEREVASRRAAVGRERGALETLQASLRAAAPSPQGAEASEAVRRARRFASAVAVLERRERDLESLRADLARADAAVAEAREAQRRLAEEVVVLRSEVEAVEARAAVAQTRRAADGAIDASGYAAAQERLQAIRDRVREQDKKLDYYAARAEARSDAEDGDGVLAASALDAVDAALAGAR